MTPAWDSAFAVALLRPPSLTTISTWLVGMLPGCTDGIYLAGIHQYNRFVRALNQGLKQRGCMSGTADKAKIRPIGVRTEKRKVKVQLVQLLKHFEAAGTYRICINLPADHGCLDIGVLGQLQGSYQTVCKNLQGNVWQNLGHLRSRWNQLL